MVLLSEVGMAGGFAWAAWKVVGQWYKFRSRTEQRMGDVEIFQQLERELQEAASSEKNPRKEGYGIGAALSGQGHIFEEWKKLPVSLRVQLLEDLAELAAWSNQLQDSKVIRRGQRKWKQMSNAEKMELLGALDQLSFEALEGIQAQSAKLASSWLWQVTESLPLLSEEPARALKPAEELAMLQKKFGKADEAVCALFDAQRSQQLGKLKQLVQPLAVAAAMRNLQVLRVLLEELGLDFKTSATKAAELREALQRLKLAPQSQEVQQQQEAAAKKFQEGVDAVVEAARSERMQEIEEAARKAFVAEVLRAAGPAQLAWAETAPFGGKLALVEVVLAELAGSSADEAGVPELVSAAKKLVPRLKLPLEGDEQQPNELLSLVEALGSEGDNTSATARKVLGLVLAAAEPWLRPAPVPVDAPAEDDTAAVKSLVAGIFRRVTGETGEGSQEAEEPEVDREAIKHSIVEEASAKSAAEEQKMHNQLEADLARLAAQEQARALAAKAADMAALTLPERLVVVGLQLQALLQASNQQFVQPASSLLQQLTADDVSSLSADSQHALQQVRKQLKQLLLAADLSKLEMGPGITQLLLSVQQHLEDLAAQQQQQEEEAAAASAAADAEDANSGEEGTAAEGGHQENGDIAATAATASSSINTEKLSKAEQLVSELLKEGLVLLELQPAANKKLQSLRETVDTLNPDMDALVWNRSMTQLKELVGQLGPIGAAVNAKLQDMDDEGRRTQLQQVRDASVRIYQSLQEFLTLDTVTRTNTLQELAAIKELVFSLKIDRSSANLESVLSKLAVVNDKAAAIVQAVQPMRGSEDAISEVYILEEQVGQLQPLVSEYLHYVRLVEHAMGAAARPAADTQPLELQPLSAAQARYAENGVWLDLGSAEEEHVEGWRHAGYTLVARGHAAVILLTGGVENEEVKVTKDVGLPSTKSLLQLYAERLLRMQQLAAEALYGPGSTALQPVNWYIMTNPVTHEATQQYLADNSYFGLQPSQVHVFSCDVAPPVINEQGKLIMENPFKVARSYGGNGELFLTLRRSGMLSHILRKGIKCLDVHTLEDNILAKIADPVFLGYCHSINLDCGAKVLEPEEVQQAFAAHSGLAGSAAGSALSQLVPASGQYYLTATFLKQLDTALQKDPMLMYRAVPHDKIVSKGAKVSGYRLERRLADFVVHDAVPGQHRGFVVSEALDEFSLVWGAPPFFTPTSPTAAVEDLLLLHTQWVEESGGQLSDEDSALEVSPLVSYEGEGLEELVAGRTFADAYDLDLQGYAVQPQKRTNVGPWFVPVAALYIAAAAYQVAKSLR